MMQMCLSADANPSGWGKKGKIGGMCQGSEAVL